MWISDYIKRKHIASILDGLKIKNYTIRKDGTVDVDGNVSLHRRLGGARRFPVQFGKVTGSFDCSYNNLEFLQGAPEFVGGGFNCSNNYLCSLAWSPKIVGEHFECQGNSRVTTLVGGPISVGSSYKCSHNSLMTLEGCPKKIPRYFWCNNNKLERLDFFPCHVGELIDLASNPLVSLDGVPVELLDRVSCDNRDELIERSRLLEAAKYGSTKDIHGAIEASYADTVTDIDI